MKELKLIERIRKTQPHPSSALRAGIGEDAAVILFGQKELLATCDCLIEEVHFLRRWGSWEDWGKKAAGAALSDIAAMGGTPRFAWVDLHLPKNFKDENAEDFYRGLYSFFIPLKISLAGGNVSRNPKGFAATLIFLGERPAGHKMLRSDAQPGDWLFLSGHPGLAALGLKLLQKKQKAPNRYVQAFLHPQPLLATGRWLRENALAHAAIDVSDGLLQDLGHLAKASQVQIIVETQKIPLDDHFRAAAQKLNLDPLTVALTGGEDYTLAFSAPPGREAILTATRRAKPIGFAQKGKPLVRVIDSRGKTVKIGGEGFQHF